MPTYVVERFVPAGGAAQIQAVVASAERVAALMSASGAPARYLQTLFLEHDEMCFCVFEAPSPEALSEAYRSGALSFTRITPATTSQPMVTATAATKERT